MLPLCIVSTSEHVNLPTFTCCDVASAMEAAAANGRAHEG